MVALVSDYCKHDDVLSCCSHFATEMLIDNLNKNSLSEINNSEKAIKLKNDLLQPFGYKKNEFCRDYIEISYNLKTDNGK